MTSHPGAPHVGVGRFVVIGALGPSAAGEDLLVVEPGVPERRVLRRLWSNVGGRRAVLERLHEARSAPSVGAPRVLEVGTDAEQRVCVVLEDKPRMPWPLAQPRNSAEAALLAHDVLRAVLDVERPRTYARGTVEAGHVHLDVQGAVGLRSLWPPRVAPEGWNAGEAGEEHLVIDIAALVQHWSTGPLPLGRRTLRDLENILRRMEPHVRPARWSPPLLADARGLLDVLTDADRKQPERIEAAYRLACVPSLAEETGVLLVRALNEPLERLPHVARDLLAERMVPMPLWVDASSGLLRRCPHEWAATEIVQELGGASVERYCADCDARVTLPQTLEVFAGRSPVADAFAAHPGA